MKSVSLLILVLALSVVPIRPASADTNAIPTNSLSQLNAALQVFDDAQSGKFYQAILPASVRVNVNYDLSVDRALAESGCQAIGYVTATNINPGIVLHGQTNVEIILLQIDHPMQPKDMLTELDHRGLRPANLAELTAFAKQFPKQEKDFEVATQGAYGLVFPFKDWLLAVSNTGGRELAVTPCYTEPQKWQWFAAVRK